MPEHDGQLAPGERGAHVLLDGRSDDEYDPATSAVGLERLNALLQQCGFVRRCTA